MVMPVSNIHCLRGTLTGRVSFRTQNTPQPSGDDCTWRLPPPEWCYCLNMLCIKFHGSIGIEIIPCLPDKGSLVDMSRKKSHVYIINTRLICPPPP